MGFEKHIIARRNYFIEIVHFLDIHMDPHQIPNFVKLANLAFNESFLTWFRRTQLHSELYIYTLLLGS